LGILQSQIGKDSTHYYASPPIAIHFVVSDWRRGLNLVAKQAKSACLCFLESKMFRLIPALIISLFVVSACIPTEDSLVHQISPQEANAIRLNQLDLVNAVRAEAGVPPLTLSSTLTAAALTHARDIAVQRRAWNFGSDRSAPQTRAERAGFSGLITGEDVAETFMSNIEIFQAWVSDPRSKQAMTDPTATHMGLGWFQEVNGKLWWVMDIGAATPVEVAMAE
jgi:uncharacterized protein YkwD